MPHHRLIILGTGTAGLSAWKQARDLTDDILMIDPGPLGTTCARVGCMPSKSLLQVALDHRAARRLHRDGLLTGPAGELDGAAVMQRVRELRDRFTAGPVRAVEKMGDGFIRGAARFVAPDCLEVDGTRYSADAIVVAAGTKPFVPKPWRALDDRLLTSDDLFEMPDIPRRVGVIGAGAIGCEIGQGLAMLGSEVHLFGRDQRLAGIADSQINDVMHEALSGELHLHLGEDARPEPTPNGVSIHFGEERIEVDLVIAAIGRRPPIEDLGLDRLDVPADDKGLPRIDPASLRAGDAPVWFAGDINGIRPIMHEAADEGRLAAWHALHPDAECMSRRTPIGIVFTEPQVAWAGQRGDDLSGEALTGECDFSRQGRSIIKGYEHGLMKVHADPDGRLVGGEMACAGAEHLAHELAWLIQQEVNVIEALQLPFYHPVLEEGMRTALQDIRRQLPERERRPDLPLCHPGEDSLPGV
ncbi:MULTISPECIES: dihydrolipoyl dehydrogenase [unclassified Wenzhouxiangella]|uniref:dihydrolipoyl dehydrogenase n=1 Tax=unclassified Wenzhouxiangella TaxID=2613841 RepID=UPI000E32549B|nr:MULTISPECIES: dihydrolipoyl dehydrogenase [unclassified Wenzhouxiangella]RFF26296.1 dihydrolipoyl dehydrogenase [Wenzhouxiangella sp. 15181]RFP67433.1 dihydrolipoyl dehydrogenase [Wenzhouxiangella sp. 15190]